MYAFVWGSEGPPLGATQELSPVKAGGDLGMNGAEGNVADHSLMPQTPLFCFYYNFLHECNEENGGPKLVIGVQKNMWMKVIQAHTKD